MKSSSIFLNWVLLAFLCLSGYSSAWTQEMWEPISPIQPRVDSPWLITDYLEESKLHYIHLFHIAFEPNGTAWISTGQGLYRYEGYLWRSFNKNDGLPSDFIRCVCVTKDGTVWVGTDKGAGVFENESFSPRGIDALAGPSVRRIVEDVDGSLWFCCDAWPDTSASAGLTVYKNQTWETFTIQDGLPSNNVMNYFRDSQGRQFVATNKGLAQRQGDTWFEPLKEAGFENVETEIWDIAETPDAGLVVSTRAAFFILQEDTWKRIPIESVYPSQIYVTKDGQAISCLQHGELERVFAAWRHDEYVEKSFIFPSLQGGIEEIVEAPDGSIWAIGFNCLVRWDRREAKWKEYLNLPPPCAVDAKGRVWFVGEGFVYVKDQNRWFAVDTSHQDFIQDANKHMWSWTTDEIDYWKTDHPLQFKKEDVGLDLFEQLFSVADNSIWVHGRDEEGHPAFAVYKKGKWEAIPSSRFARHEMLRLRPDAKQGLWALTKNIQDNQIHLFYIQSQSVDELPLNENIQSLANSSNFYDLTIDANRNAWFYGRDLLTVFKSEDNEARQWDYIPGINGRTVYSVHTRGDEEWISMRGDGLEFSGVAELKEIRIGWRFYPLDVFLFSKMLSDQTIYFSGYGRMFIIPPNWKRVPITLRIPKLGGIHQLVKEGDGTFWIHMDDAIIRYHPDGIPPETFIYNPVQRILEGETLRVECIGKSRYVITESAHQFRFSWQIDDNAWNAFQTIPDEGLPLGGLGPGNHVFRVRAQDEDFEVDPSPVTMEFYVHPSSVLDRPEFQIFLFGIFLLITFLAIYALYARKQLADYAVNLESMVESRAAALKESESRYRELVQNANSIILRMTPKGEITFFNEFAEDFFGYGSDEILSHTIFDTLIPKDKDSKANLDSLLKTIQDSPDQSQYQEMEGMTKEGDRVWIAWTFKQIITENEEKPEILSIGSDITEHKRLEEQLHQAHKMEAVGQLAGGVAHNINNLLTGVIGNLSLVMSEAPESIKESLLAARQAANRAAGLVKELLAFSRKSTLRLDTIDVNQTIKEVYHLIRETFDRRIEIQIQTQDRLPPVKADLSQIHSVFMNLCINARDAIEKVMSGQEFPERRNEQFTIRMHTEIKEISSQEAINHPFASPGVYVNIRISDNGSGIDENTQKHIFEPFFTTKKEVGTGLGLASAFGIVKQHNGWIDFTSHHGGGTTFNIYLPALEPVSRETEPEQEYESSLNGKETILFVDDEDIILSLGQRILESQGYKVLTAVDGMQSLDVYDENKEEIDLVILDLSMPKLSGNEVLEEMLSLNENAKILISSGHADGYDYEALMEKGAVGIISKPYQPKDLLQQVRKILDT